MANCGYITVSKKVGAVAPEGVESDLTEILQRRFQGKLSVKKPYGARIWKISPAEDLGDHGLDAMLSFSICLQSNRKKFELRAAELDWTSWVQIIVKNELAEKYDGVISDEGVEETWKADTTKFPMYKDWFAYLNRVLLQQDPATYARVYEQQIKRLPETFRELKTMVKGRRARKFG